MSGEGGIHRRFLTGEPSVRLHGQRFFSYEFLSDERAVSYMI